METLVERYRGHLTVALLVALAIGGSVWWDRRPLQQELRIAAPVDSSSQAARWLTVDVAGAVLQPGIYTLRDGSRIADAIAAAGGETDDADLSRVNRAQRLRDEQQVRIPRLAPTPIAGLQQPLTNPLVDLNTATQTQLDGLPGIGPVIAQRIIAYRDRNGPFARIEQLVETKLVPASTFEKIKDLISVH